MDCSVCCEKLNKSNHKNIICGYCNFSACKTCIQKYLMESSQDPHCMNCKKIFTRDFLNDNCTKVFINTDLRTHRETVLLDRQKCLIPETHFVFVFRIFFCFICVYWLKILVLMK